MWRTPRSAAARLWLALVLLGSAAAFAPPLFGLPLAAYVGVAALLQRR